MGGVLRSFKPLHSAVAQLETSHAAASSSSVVDWVASVSTDSAFVASDYRRLLPPRGPDRVNVVGTLSVGTLASSTPAVSTSDITPAAAAWDELRDKVQPAVFEIMFLAA